MAEEVPVSDVLCDAMEYLCKLGSNLRSRSQNLKDKKISKEKLRNAHAVRKAASKVLLICELSRKSLDNVEIGVKRVLTLLDASRCTLPTVGAKSENDSKKNFFFFEYDSCKLRISKKIVLNHYTSVKVHAKKMSPSMVDKYPVYYDCSLYRKRRQSLKDNKKGLESSRRDEPIKSVKVKDSDSDTSVSGEIGKKSIGKKVGNDRINSDESDNSSKHERAEGKSKNKPGPNKSKKYEDRNKHESNSSDGHVTTKHRTEKRERKDKQARRDSKTDKEKHKNHSKFDDSDDSSENIKKDIKTKEANRKEEKSKSNSESEESCNIFEKENKSESERAEKEKSINSKQTAKRSKQRCNVIDVIVDSGDNSENTEKSIKSKDTNKNSEEKNKSDSENEEACNTSEKESKSESERAEEEKPNDSKQTAKRSKQICNVIDDIVDSGDNSEKTEKSIKIKDTSNKKKEKSKSDSENEEACNMSEKENKSESERAEKEKPNDSKQTAKRSKQRCNVIDDIVGDNSENTEKTIKTKDNKKEEKRKSDSEKEKEKSNDSKQTAKRSKQRRNVIDDSDDDTPVKVTDRPDSPISVRKEKIRSPKQDQRRNAIDDSDDDTPVKVTDRPDSPILVQEEKIKSPKKDPSSSSQQHDVAESLKKPSNQSNRLSDEIKTIETSNSAKNRKTKSVQFLDSDSDNDDESSQHIAENERKKRKLDRDEKKSVLNEPEIIDLLDDSPMKAKEDIKQAKLNENSESSAVKKPTIKLVSLNKLLKPDVLQKEMDDNLKNTQFQSFTKTYENQKLKRERAYQEQKRREVSAFKPKKFDIVVSRLPKLSDNFLCKYELKKITQNGSVVYSLANQLSKDQKNKNNDLNKNRSSRSKSRESETCVNIDLTDDTKKMDEGIEETKNALLNSDSDDSDINKNLSKSKKIMNKNSNQKVSDSEKSEDSEGKNNSRTIPIRKSQSKEKSPATSDPEKIISLDSADREKTPESDKKETEKVTPQSKRKLIMETMHAKKMLLTYSSSSDTEDDQLTSTLKEIKNSLLKGSSSEEEIDVKKMVKMNRRRLATPPDSDDSIKIIKKNKKKPSIPEDTEPDDSSISQVDGTNDEESNSGGSQMGRSKTKVASSSNQSSENVDSNDSEINRLANLKTLNRSRRRRSGDAHATRSTRRMPKAPPIEDEMLAPLSSASLSDSDHEEHNKEELPVVTIQGLNGDGINHMAKEDLLAESEPSSSENEKANESGDDKKDDDSEEETVKSTRRKANAITSDSDAEASRRQRISDFEDSEDESNEPRKKTKRKKKGSDSDGSLSSSADGSKKKRRRIKQLNDSDGSGSDSENEGKNKHGRKNIRKVMSKDQLEEATKKAARQEKERIARIQERQKLYNNLEFDESGKPDEVVLDKVVLDFNPETKEPIIEVDRGLVKKLKPHQANGIKFMWNACFESVKRIKKDRGSGCILAHCMGLGKTLQVVSLTHTLLTHSELTGVKRVLVVCPLSTVLNWVNEFSMWLKHADADRDVDVFELSRHKQNSERSWQLQQWVECGGVCVLGYEMFRNLSADNNKKFKKKMLKTFQEALVDPGPDLVVCDEGHLLKNEKTSLSQSMNRVRTMRRIVLTGTPLQNNLKEYYCMVQFVKPNLLGKYNEYLNRFVNPITNGQYTDSTERDISIMKRRSHVLHTMLDGAVQRRDYGVLAPFLPPKHEYVLFITLTEIQVKLYQHYLDNYSRRPLPGKSSGFLFPDFQSLQRIWTHPLVLKYNSERYEIMQQKKRDKEEEDSEGSLADFIDDDSTPEESSTDESSDDLSDLSDDSRKKSKKKAKAKKGKSKDAKGTGRRGTRANPVEMEEDKPNSDIEEVKYENPTEWWMRLVTDEELEDIRHSHKLLLLFDILRQCEAIGDKLLVFSQSLYSLDLIEHFLGKIDEATQEGRIDEKLAGHVGSWSPGVDYFRLDGSTSCENRSIWCKNFNREDNPRARLFLISTRAGGLGINLVAANRVVIFDVSWNPSHDVQSIFRVYRFGQKKPCYIYRFLAMGTMEEKIYERQVTKQAISKRVIDEQQIDRHYAANDLAELYKFEPVPPEPRPVPSLPKDRLFAEMLKDHEKQIFRFHEHDSLLENKEEETLSEEERKKAWEEFENEKKAPPPSPFPNNWSMHNGMASLLQQQQQQLAYAALAAMIRKDMPNINDNQIRDMLPIICNANPGMFGGYDYGLMQKMSEIYKYAQPGMMNPSMMNNPMMNPAGGGMSTSSLQYEPPWQRQQQQQQQMRLQQLMQQQQNMNAKYYAGGLGSRDPVAMAMQQQRAREMLLGSGAAPAAAAAAAAAGARPRGRPPLQPRAPPAPAQDVVNLADSD